MRNISFLLAGMLLGAGLVYIPTSCNAPKSFTSTENYSPYSIKSINDPEKDSFISYRSADTMQQRYLGDPRKFPFVYHDNATNPGHTVRDILKGVLVKQSSLDNLYKTTGCDKFYLMYGINITKRTGFPGTKDTLLTTIVVPIKTDFVDGKPVYHIATNTSGTLIGDTTTLEYSSPCPPYCPTSN